MKASKVDIHNYSNGVTRIIIWKIYPSGEEVIDDIHEICKAHPEMQYAMREWSADPGSQEKQDMYYDMWNFSQIMREIYAA
jgi:hypothetical protein